MAPDPAVVDGRVVSSVSAGRPSWLALRARPESAAKARTFAATAVFGYPFDAYEVSLVTSELVTNAILGAAGLRQWPHDAYPIGVQILATERYVHLAVTDPHHRPIPAADRGGLLAEGGRGVAIVDQHATARWVIYAEHGKTVHVVIPASGVDLTPAELTAIGVPV